MSLSSYDGYWLLSDASGIPNLHKRVAEVIQNILFKFRRTKIGNRDNHFSFSNLRRSSAIALWVYAIVSVICWPLLIVMTLPALIQLLTNYPSDIGKDLAGVFVAIQQLDAISFGKHSLALFVPALLMLNLGLIAKYMLHRTLTLLAKFTQESLMHKNVNVKWFAFGAGTGSIGTIFIVALIGFFFLRPNGLLMGGLSEGTLAPEFVGSDLKSQSVRLSDYRGKTVVLKFWSPDCEPCRDDVATMKQAYQKLGGPTVAFITVSAHTSKTRTESFSTEQNIEYPVVIDEQGTIANLYNVTGIPFTYVIDANGKITSAKVGPRSMSELEKDILPCTNGACFSK